MQYCIVNFSRSKLRYDFWRRHNNKTITRGKRTNRNIWKNTNVYKIDGEIYTVESMYYTFCNIENLSYVPEIPSSVTDMPSTFDYCFNLTIEGQ